MIKYIIYTILFTLTISPLVAQDIGADQTIPMDPDIRIGKLDNGLTYYIRHSENPKNRGEFYIVHNVGAMQEEDNQNGLAHFLNTWLSTGQNISRRKPCWNTLPVSAYDSEPT